MNIYPSPESTLQLEKLLLLSSAIDNNEDIKQVSAYIEQNRLASGFIPTLIQIITNNLPRIEGKNNCYHLVFASLIELKNLARRFWLNMNGGPHLDPNDKEFLISRIIQLNFHFYQIPDHQTSYKFRKLMKDIVEITRYDSIKIYREVVHIIESSTQMEKFERLPFCLNILLAWSYQQTSNPQDHVSTYTEMTKQVHPLLLSFIKEGNQLIQALYDELTSITEQEEVMKCVQIYGQVKRKFQEILYLSIKLVYRASNFDGVDSYRQMALEWADVAMTKIRHCYVPEQYCEKNEGSDMGVRGNDRFNFYHGKKWALKFMNRLFERVLVCRKNNPQYNNLTAQFYDRNMETILDIFRECWDKEEPNNIRYEELRCFDRLVASKNAYLAKHKPQEMRLYLSKILPGFIQMGRRQLAIIEDNPVQFISHEANMNYFTVCIKSSRMMATDVWVKIAKLSEYLTPVDNNPYLLFCFALIKHWTERYDPENLTVRDIGCYLLSKLNVEFLRIKSIKAELVDLLEKIIRDNLENPTHFMVLARALDLVITYHCILPLSLQTYIRSHIVQLYKKLHRDLATHPTSSQIFIMVKACVALQKVISSCTFLESQLRIIIFTNFQLVKLTFFDDIMRAVDIMLHNFIEQIPGFGLQVLQHIKDWFREFARVEEQDEERGLRYIELANGVLGVVTTLTRLCATGDKKIIEALENEILSISGFVMDGEEDIAFEYKEGAINLISTFLYWYPSGTMISKRMLVLCKRCLLKIAGLPKQLYKMISEQAEKLRNEDPENDKLKTYEFLQTCEEVSYNSLQANILFVRSYVKYIPFGEAIRPMQEIQKIITSKNVNQTELIIYVAYRFFTEAVNEEYGSPSANRFTALVFLVLYYDQHQVRHPHPRVHHSVNEATFAIIEASMKMQSDFPKITKYLSQLFSLWVMEVKTDLFGFFNHWERGKVRKLFDNVFIYDREYGLPELDEANLQVRCIYGISHLLRLALQSEELWNILSDGNIRTLVKYAIDFTDQTVQDMDFSGMEEWQDDIRDFEKTDLQDLTMPELLEDTNRKPKEKNKEIHEQQYPGPMLLQAHHFSHQNDEQQYYNLFQALTDDDYVCPLLTVNLEHIHLLETLHLLFQRNQKYYENIIDEEYRDKLETIVQRGGLAEDSNYNHLQQLYLGYYGQLYEEETDI